MMKLLHGVNLFLFAITTLFFQHSHHLVLNMFSNIQTVFSFQPGIKFLAYFSYKKYGPSSASFNFKNSYKFDLYQTKAARIMNIRFLTASVIMIQKRVILSLWMHWVPARFHCFCMSVNFNLMPKNLPLIIALDITQM